MEMLQLIHSIEVKMGRRLSDEEYNQVLNHIENELRMRSIREGLQKLYSLVEKLPSEVKEAIIKL